MACYSDAFNDGWWAEIGRLNTNSRNESELNVKIEEA